MTAKTEQERNMNVQNIGFILHSVSESQGISTMNKCLRLSERKAPIPAIALPYQRHGKFGVQNNAPEKAGTRHEQRVNVQNINTGWQPCQWQGYGRE